MATAAISSNAQIGIEDFMRILVAQLSNQDPLKPMDNTEFVTQLAQFTSLQQTQEINTKLTDLLSGQSAAQSVGMLGRTVDFVTSGASQSGKVQAINYVNGEPRLSVALTSTGAVVSGVSLADVTAIR